MGMFSGEAFTTTVTRVSTASDGTQANGASGGAVSVSGLYVGNGVISADGRYVAFASAASNLVNGDGNGGTDLFVKDLQPGAVTRIDTTSPLGPAWGELDDWAFSADGTRLLYSVGFKGSYYGDYGHVEINILDLGTNARTTIQNGRADAYDLQLSVDGKTLVYGNEPRTRLPGPASVVYRDVETGTVSIIPGVYERSVVGPVLSPDGQSIAYSTIAYGKYNGIFLRNLRTGAESRLDVLPDGTPHNGPAGGPVNAFSSDGRYVLFTSATSDILPGDGNGVQDVFVRDLLTGTTRLVSTAADGTQANAASSGVAFGPDGTSVLFTSAASNLVEGDTNGTNDVFLKDLESGAVRRVSVAADGSQLNGLVTSMSVSADGTRVLFATPASNVVDGDTNGVTDLFVVTLASPSGDNATPLTDTTSTTDMQRTVGGVSETVKASAYSGPVSSLKWSFMGDDRGEALNGSSDNDFINMLGGDDAANGQAGDDVLDGGAGSNFLTGGAGNDTFFVDARGGLTTWSTVTDLDKGEWATVWGYNPGTSKLTWEEMGGADGFKGATAHVDIDGNGTIDASMTFTGKSVGSMSFTTGNSDGNNYIAFINL